MQLDVNVLLSGWRGRRLCLEFVLPDQGRISPEGATLSEVLFSARYRLEAARGRAGTLFGPGANEPLPDQSVADVASALDGVPLDAVTDTNSLQALAATVDTARYWQEPDGTDELLLNPGLRHGLERVARHLVASSSTAWWSTPAAAEQWRVEFSDPEIDIPPRPAAGESLALWLREELASEVSALRDRPVDPDADWSGEWWSKPPWALTTSTRFLPTHGPVGLWLIEDALGWKAAEVQRVHHEKVPRICEITGPDVWAELCRSYPLDITATRRHAWYRTTGRSGRWVIPDWSQVARDFDAVHLSVSGYLALAGVLVAVDDEAASVLAGWNPDETYWLTDVSLDPATRVAWSLDDDTGGWATRE